MKNKNVSWLLLSLLSLLVACRSQPEFINHPPPNLTVAFDAFEGNSTLAALGCDEIQATHSLVGGLNPAYPIAECVIIPEQVNAETQAEIDKGLYFYYTGGLFGRYIRYVIFQDGEFLELTGIEKR